MHIYSPYLIKMHTLMHISTYTHTDTIAQTYTPMSAPERSHRLSNWSTRKWKRNARDLLMTELANRHFEKNYRLPVLRCPSAKTRTRYSATVLRGSPQCVVIFRFILPANYVTFYKLVYAPKSPRTRGDIIVLSSSAFFEWYPCYASRTTEAGRTEDESIWYGSSFLARFNYSLSFHSLLLLCYACRTT